MGEISLDLQLRHAKCCLVEYGEKLKKAELKLQQARQEVARECHELAMRPLSTIKPCCLVTANEIADKIKTRFKLEESNA